MYTYLYYEASQLNSVHHEMSGRILQNVVVMTVIMGVLLLVALRHSIRISRSITLPLNALCKRAEAVTRSNLMVREPVSAVNQRLQLQFGSEYRLQLESREGIGTAVTIRFPYQEKGAV